MTEPRSERQQIADRLRDVIESHGYNVTDLERKMKRGRGYVAEALRGSKRLSIELIFEVLAAVGAELHEVFTFRRRTHHASEIAEGEPAGGADALPASMRDASPLLQALVLALTERGIVSVDELDARQRGVGGWPPPST